MLKLRNVFLAEDDEDDRYFFRQVIGEINPEINLELVGDGRQLLDLLQHFCPDLLFLDLEMPYKNGLECLQEIRAKESLRELPVIVFSSTNRPANIQTAYEMGADLFLLKSASMSEYKASLQAVLNLDWDHPRAIREQYLINDRYTAFS